MQPYGRHYAVCQECGTLVSLSAPSAEDLIVRDDDQDFYGKHYWLEHQRDDLGSPDILSRARSDLTERNVHWLKTVLKYRLPPANILEIGCGHGSFVALMRQAGYNGAGVEVSPWVVDFARNTFGVPIHNGSIEALDYPANSVDVMVLMDVIEHLPEPYKAMSRCFDLLRPDGLLIVQTPRFKEGEDVGAMLEKHDRFVEMMLPDEHIYLFSERSITQLFGHLGANYIAFEPAIFAHYDMFFVVSREPLKPHSRAEIESALLATPQGRIALAILDLRERELTLSNQLRVSEHDRAARLEQIEKLTGLVQELEGDRQARGTQITTLTELVIAAQAKLNAERKKLEARLLGAGTRRRAASEIGMSKILSTIAVDLTPVLPGGENGGAKLFVIDLLERLAEMMPRTRFLLLTQASSHEELAHMDRANMQRMLVVGPMVATALKPRMTRLASRLLPHLPSRVRLMLGNVGYRLNTALKRNSSSTLLRSVGADLLFCPFTAPTYFEPGIPTVCTIYDLQYKTYPEFFSPEEVAHRDGVFHDACKRAAILCAISEYSRQSALKHSNLDPARIRTIHLRMAQRIAPRECTDCTAIQRLGLEPERYLVFPANFWRHKNHEMLLTAFGMARRDGLEASIKLVCTGAPGARQTWLASAARAMGLGEQVLFPGYLPTQELAALISNARGVVFPSLYEGFGLPVIEAMAAGVPVACSNNTALAEVAADAAILFDPRLPSQIVRALLSLTQDAELRDRLIASGWQRAAAFADSAQMAREYWEVFESAIADENLEYALRGAYADGWTGPHLEVQVAPSARPSELQLEVAAPDWVPYSRVTLRANARGSTRTKKFKVRRGSSTICKLPLGSSGGHIEIDISPTFIPSHSGHGDDARELSVMLRRCGIVIAQGERVELFPQGSSS